jgi:hypothetical protein
MLRKAFLALKKDAAPGVDGLTWEAYEADLDRETLASPRWAKPIAKLVLGVGFTDRIEVAKEQAQTAA